MTFRRLDLIEKAKKLLSAVIEERLYKHFGRNVTGKFKVNTVMVAVDTLLENTTFVERVLDAYVDQDGKPDREMVDQFLEQEMANLKASINIVNALMEDQARLYEVMEGFIEFLNHATEKNVMIIWERYYTEAKGLIVGEQGA